MCKYDGFSLTEVLIALLLMSGTSLALFQQYWQSHRLFNQLHFKTQALVLLNSASEQVLAGRDLCLEHSDAFNVFETSQSEGVQIKVTWPCASKASNQSCCLRRDQLIQP